MLPDLYGYRARIGLIYTSTSTVMEPECYAMTPEGVSIHTTRVELARVTVEELRKLAERTADAARVLAMAPLHSMVFGCTSGSFVEGRSYDERIIETMRVATGGLPVTTTASAAANGLRAVGAQRIVLATPYLEEVTARGAAYFAEQGFEVLATSSLGFENDHDIGRTSPERVYGQVRELDRPDADAVFISCTNLRTVAILQELEEDLAKPVLSANQASFWEALRLAGIGEPVVGFGRLLQL
jgi:maleate isomerase